MQNQITVTVAGANRVELVENLRAFADNLDGSPAAPNGKVAAKTTTKKTAAATVVEEDAADDSDDGFATDTGETNGFDDDTAEEEAPSKKAMKGTAKAKKITMDDVNDACKAHAQAKGRPATLAILQKKFKTQTVTALKPEQFEACISAMAVN